MIQRFVEAVILRSGVVILGPGGRRNLVKYPRKIDAVGFPMAERFGHIDPVDAADHLIHRPEAHFRHDRAEFFGDEKEIIDHMLRLTSEALAQNGVLRRDPDGTGVQMAFPHHDATRCNQRRSGKTELIRAQQRPDGHIAPSAQPAVHLNRNPATQIVQEQSLLCLRQPDFPRRTSVGERGEGGGPGSAFIAGNGDMIRARL